MPARRAAARLHRGHGPADRRRFTAIGCIIIATGRAFDAGHRLAIVAGIVPARRGALHARRRFVAVVGHHADGRHVLPDRQRGNPRAGWIFCRAGKSYQEQGRRQGGDRFPGNHGYGSPKSQRFHRLGTAVSLRSRRGVQASKSGRGAAIARTGKVSHAPPCDVFSNIAQWSTVESAPLGSLTRSGPP